MSFEGYCCVNSTLWFLFHVQQEVDEFRRTRELSVSGRNVPKPVFTFEDASFPGENSFNSPIRGLTNPAIPTKISLVSHIPANFFSQSHIL